MQQAFETDSLSAMSELMCALLVDTDITEGGVPLAITPENLERLGLPLLSLISEGVQADFSLGKQRGTASLPASNGT